jgi:hypothetical protein
VGQGTADRFSAEAGLNDKLIETYGIDLLDVPYSASLGKTLLRCLAYDWRERSNIRSLAKMINHALSLLDPGSQDLDDQRAGGINHPEPSTDSGDGRGDVNDKYHRPDNASRTGRAKQNDDADGRGGGGTRHRFVGEYSTLESI